MNDGEALLAAIVASPDEDTPRLMYADWLDEQGKAERAELIRVGIAWQRAPRLNPRHKKARYPVPGHQIHGRLCHVMKSELAEQTGLQFAAPASLTFEEQSFLCPGDRLAHALCGWRGSDYVLKAYVSRGFVSHVAAPLSWLLSNGRSFFARQPVLVASFGPSWHLAVCPPDATHRWWSAFVRNRNSCSPQDDVHFWGKHTTRSEMLDGLFPWLAERTRAD